MAPNKQPPMNRFVKFIAEGPAVSEELGPCTLWTGSLYTDGYGKFWFEGKSVRAHRWILAQNGIAIPDGHEPDHLCRVRRCVRVEHMEVVTQQENLRRAGALHRGRPVGGGKRNIELTHCKRNHEFTEENTRVYRGRRHCRKCAVIFQKNARARKAAA